jgi:hypothetical protein
VAPFHAAVRSVSGPFQRNRCFLWLVLRVSASRRNGPWFPRISPLCSRICKRMFHATKIWLGVCSSPSAIGSCCFSQVRAQLTELGLSFAFPSGIDPVSLSCGSVNCWSPLNKTKGSKSYGSDRDTGSINLRRDDRCNTRGQFPRKRSAFVDLRPRSRISTRTPAAGPVFRRKNG